MKNLAILSLAAISLAGCAASGVSSVSQIGKDSYTVRAISERSTSDAKLKALQTGQEYCKEQNRSVMLVKEFSGTENDTNEKYYDLTFLCVTQGDPDFTRVKANSFVNTPAEQQ